MEPHAAHNRGREGAGAARPGHATFAPDCRDEPGNRRPGPERRAPPFIRAALFMCVCAVSWGGAASERPVWRDAALSLRSSSAPAHSALRGALKRSPAPAAGLRQRLALRGGGEWASAEDEDIDMDAGFADSDSDVSVELTSVIGFGSFSTVYAGETRAGEKMAVKRIHLQNADVVNMKRLQREIRILALMDHPNIVRLLRVIEDDECVSLVQERCMGGELFDFVNDFQTFHANGERSWRRTNTTEMLTVTEDHVAKMVRQILLAVDYMHSINVVHRDLKLENVMLTEPFTADGEPEVKVVDLGFSRQVIGDNEMFTACGSTLYIAPEVLLAKTTGKGYGRECDLWAVGVIAYILLCCRPPFSGDTSYSVGQAIQKGAFTYPDYALVSKEAKELIAGLLDVDPSRRLTAKQALQTEWIAAVAPAGDGAPERQKNASSPRSTSLTTWLRSFVNTLAGAGSAIPASGAASPGLPLPV